MNKINDAHDECSLCGDVGEVTITAWTKQNGDKRETVGCPLCIQTERDTEIAALKQRVADLESVAQAEPVVRSLLSPEDIKALRRFAECCEDSDSGGHDVSKEAMKRLELAGAVRSLGFRRHETTKFGDYVLEDAAPALLAAAPSYGRWSGMILTTPQIKPGPHWVRLDPASDWFLLDIKQTDDLGYGLQSAEFIRIEYPPEDLHAAERQRKELLDRLTRIIALPVHRDAMKLAQCHAENAIAIVKGMTA
ncbi:hypothetical protein LHK_01680 [Laribacter hongkongensis HLHK9]|uniref:Uncharacterized protein n=1 Tax=Laribacter hongkongensis (strain HLHK9) TaxID=557598 RepID=C1D875_LARHH|nr:hypothetical protein [Laribacter hongkongensis]ACO74665.1 hypothetical protein LHK_01680 [Laribacter hongkongensis HLHK9]